MACGEALEYGSAMPDEECVWCRDGWQGDHQHLICYCSVPYSVRRGGYLPPPPRITKRIYMAGIHSGSWNQSKPFVKWGTKVPPDAATADPA